MGVSTWVLAWHPRIISMATQMDQGALLLKKQLIGNFVRDELLYTFYYIYRFTENTS